MVHGPRIAFPDLNRNPPVYTPVKIFVEPMGITRIIIHWFIEKNEQRLRTRHFCTRGLNEVVIREQNNSLVLVAMIVVVVGAKKIKPSSEILKKNED